MIKVDFRNISKMNFRNDYGVYQTVTGQTWYWTQVLRGLKNDSGLPLFNDEFEDWLKKEWGITSLHEEQDFRSHLTGLSMNDETFTMILLRFQYED